MKITTYNSPKSSFLSAEKDMAKVSDLLLKNTRLQKLLYYTVPDCMSKPELTDDEKLGLFGKNIKLVPKLTVDGSVLNYIIISFDNFTTNMNNPEFRDNVIEIDIICHFDQWQMPDFELRPYKIAGEIDYMLDNKKLTGIGETHFLGANQIVLNSEYAGLCLMYDVTHGEEDKKFQPNPDNEEQFLIDFNNIFNTDSK